MFNVAVVKMKDIIKYIGMLMVTILIVAIILNMLKNSKDNGQKNEINILDTLKGISGKTLINCLNQSFPIMSKINNKDIENTENEQSKSDILGVMLETQISSMKGFDNEDIEKDDNEETNLETTASNVERE